MSILRKKSNKKVKRQAPKRVAGKRSPAPRNKLRVEHSRSLMPVEEELYEEALPVWKLLITLILGLIFLLPCIAVTKMLFWQITSSDIVWQLRGNPLAAFFTIGGATTIALMLVPAIRALLLPVYVFGHELTHAIFVYICYGNVSALKASADGGYIIANRANILVSLSPYIFPFWTISLALTYGFANLFLDLNAATPYFFILFGASWAFNIFWTIWMIPLGQSDLSSNGTFFSLTIIYFTNALGLSVLLEFTKISSSLSEWLFTLINIHSDLFYSIVTMLKLL